MHVIALRYAERGDGIAVYFTDEAQNINNAAVINMLRGCFGVQLPDRTLYLKTTMTL